MKKILAVAVLILVLGGAYWFLMNENNNAGSSAENSSPTVSKSPLSLSANGQHLTDSKGRTLYVNVDDENPAGTIIQSCDATCERDWLPYLFDEKLTMSANSSDPLLSRLNVFTRTDGKNQYAMGTQPLYRSVADTKAGDMNGAVNATWMVAKP